MSHNIRSKTYMQVAARERSHRAQIIQVALGLLVLLSILLWNQMANSGAMASQGSIEAGHTAPAITLVQGADLSN